MTLPFPARVLLTAALVAATPHTQLGDTSIPKQPRSVLYLHEWICATSGVLVAGVCSLLLPCSIPWLESSSSCVRLVGAMMLAESLLGPILHFTVPVFLEVSPCHPSRGENGILRF